MNLQKRSSEKLFFKEISKGEVTHTTVLDSATVGDHQSVVGCFTQKIMKALQLITGYDLLYGFVKVFVRGYLFGHTVDLKSPNTMRNLSAIAATKTVIKSFKKAINELTVHYIGKSEIKDAIRLRKTRRICCEGSSLPDAEKERVQPDHRRQSF